MADMNVSPAAAFDTHHDGRSPWADRQNQDTPAAKQAGFFGLQACRLEVMPGAEPLHLMNDASLLLSAAVDSLDALTEAAHDADESSQLREAFHALRYTLKQAHTVFGAAFDSLDRIRWDDYFKHQLEGGRAACEGADKGNVHELAAYRQGNTVAVLRELLERAEAGQMHGLAYCFKSGPQIHRVGFSGSYHDDPETALIAAGRMAYKANQLIGAVRDEPATEWGDI